MAPEVSVTVPRMVPVISWAAPGAGRKNRIVIREGQAASSSLRHCCLGFDMGASKK
jgi:hypothetical protein